MWNQLDLTTRRLSLTLIRIRILVFPFSRTRSRNYASVASSERPLLRRKRLYHYCPFVFLLVPVSLPWRNIYIYTHNRACALYTDKKGRKKEKENEKRRWKRCCRIDAGKGERGKGKEKEKAKRVKGGYPREAFEIRLC